MNDEAAYGSGVWRNPGKGGSKYCKRFLQAFKLGWLLNNTCDLSRTAYIYLKRRP